MHKETSVTKDTPATETAPKMTIKRYPPSADLAHFVEYYWIGRQNSESSEAFAVQIDASVSVNVVITAKTAEIIGLATTTFTHELTGDGVVLGITYKPGGFYPFLKKPIDRLTNRVVPLSSVFGSTRIKKIASELDQPDQMLVLAVEKLLRSKRPAEDPNIDAIGAILTRIQEDPQLTTVQAVCEAYDMSERTLQRTFQHYVGIGLKWIISYYRL